MAGVLVVAGVGVAVAAVPAGGHRLVVDVAGIGEVAAVGERGRLGRRGVTRVGSMPVVLGNGRRSGCGGGVTVVAHAPIIPPPGI